MADPKLEIWFMEKAGPVITINGEPLTPEEEELAAVVVACVRDGLAFFVDPGPPHNYYEIDEYNPLEPTPLAAWRAYREEVGKP
jgi:hypothetical protein